MDIALSACFDEVAVRMRRTKPFELSYKGLVFLVPWFRVNYPDGASR